MALRSVDGGDFVAGGGVALVVEFGDVEFAHGVVLSVGWGLPAFKGHAVGVPGEARQVERAVFALAVEHQILLGSGAGAGSIHRPGDDAPAGQRARSDHRLPEIPNLPSWRPNIDDP